MKLSWLMMPWMDAPGWEYDLLRSLPRDKAMWIWRRAWQRAATKRLGSRDLQLFKIIFSMSTLSVWFVPFGLGWGVAGHLAVVAIYHLTLGRFLWRKIIREQNQFLRPFVYDELLVFARDEMTPVGVEWLAGLLKGVHR